jgi:hypothetical protein
MLELLLFARTAAFTIANVQLPFHITPATISRALGEHPGAFDFTGIP